MVRVEVSGLSKSFAGPVLNGVDLELAQGSIHGLVGENGAGKSTLINILSGLLEKDDGSIRIDGLPHSPRGMKEALASGVSLAAQELSLIENLSVAENILLKALPRGFFGLDLKQITHQSKELLELVGLEDISPEIQVSQLSLTDKQLVELAKALSTDARLLILDEPTSALTGPQADRLHEIIRERADQGASVLYVSHRLDDVLKVCDTVSVLRDGEIDLTSSSENLTTEDLIRSMSGQTLLSHRNDQQRTVGTPRLQVAGLQSADLPNPITLTCHKGEVLGIAGLAGAGRSELLQAIYGLADDRLGEVRLLDGDKSTPLNSAKDAVKNGVGYVAEDRKTEGIFADKSVAMNTTLAGLDRISTGWGRLLPSRERQCVIELIDQLKITCEGPEQIINRLSGGNQQKTMLGRWIHSESDVWLLDEPTRGVDVAAKHAIHDQLRDLRDKGAAMIIVSSEIEELTVLCDRILVLSNRKLVASFDRGEWTNEAILHAAFSEYAMRTT